MNLVINAAEAIGDAAGTIHLALRRELLDSHRNASLAVRSVRGAGDHLCLEVSDDGPGMDEATRNRIFDPFFTTKAAPGHGLGLASVMGIVRAHQGGLRVDSAPHKGTRMRVWLPLSEERRRARPARPRRITPAPAKGFRVLVVDDEALVRQVTTSLLEARGFQVAEAADGDSAIAIARDLRLVDAVVLDMTMPGPPLHEVHRTLRQLLPDAPILLTSGYSEPEVLSDLLADPATRFLQKPYGSDDLVGQLRDLLEPKQP